MSIELQQAFERDETLLNEDGSFEYVTDEQTNESPVIDVEPIHKNESENSNGAAEEFNQDEFFNNESSGQ